MGQTTGQDNGATMFMAGRIGIAVIAVVAVLWAMTYAINQFVGDQGDMALKGAPVVALFKKSPPVGSETPAHPLAAEATSAEVPLAAVPLITTDAHGVAPLSDEAVSGSAGPHEQALSESAPTETAAAKPAVVEPIIVNPVEPSRQSVVVFQKQPAVSPAAPVQENQTAGRDAAVTTHGSQPGPGASTDNTEFPATTGHLPAAAPTPVVRPVGVALVDAIIKPLDYELGERFWGWRPNDIINITDNVENFQLGVLEVTRRAIVELAQRISRTGSADSFDRNLENAMSWIMTKATDYWFPSPETKYEETLDELRSYKTKLLNGNAFFYTRADNLIPLFEVFEDLLGSCDQNLVKHMEADGTKVGIFHRR